MDLLYGHDSDMVEFLDSSDMFQTPMTGLLTPDSEGFENDWLNYFLDDPVLNDKMMTDAMQPPCIKSEHSYSLNDDQPGSPLGLTSQDDVDCDLFLNTSALDLTVKATSTVSVKTEETSPDVLFTTASTTPTYSISRQPTIIVTATSVPAISSSFSCETLAFPTIHIKQEPADCLDQVHEQNVNLESVMLPPTPPGSSASDSEGSSQHSAPSSPVRQTSFRHSSSSSSSSSLSSSSPVSSKGYTQSLFLNAISPSGVLILSEEEKRTLVSEGYPIPTKLPLTKQEEKNLKKVRRKIKNKISAQESRRKKKEYLEALEKRVEAYNHENNDLKKKVENLENNNRSLLGQLQKLQSLVSKMPKAASATHTGTALMVLVFCFAVFLGSMSPSNLNIGYSAKPPVIGFAHSQQLNVIPQQEMGPQPSAAEDTSNHYTTPNLKSRMLMSVDQEDYCDDYRAMPWENTMSCPMLDTSTDKHEELRDPGIDMHGGAEIAAVDKTAPDSVVVMVVAASMENNSDTTETTYHPHSIVPDVKMVHSEMLTRGRLQNMSVELETA